MNLYVFIYVMYLHTCIYYTQTNILLDYFANTLKYIYTAINIYIHAKIFLKKLSK